jgi:PAS domain S-box-containing protein
LKESEERYRFVAEHAQDIITVTDINGAFLFASPSIEYVLGIKPGELIGKKSVREFLSPQDIVKFNPKIKQLVNTGEVQTLEFHFTSINRDVWLEARISLVKDESGGMRFITISRDVTQRKKDHEERDRALAQAEMLLEKLSVVGGFVRHDIRNKLSHITHTLYLSKKSSNNDAKMLNQIEQISSTTKSILRILEFSQTYEAVGSQGLTWISVPQAIVAAQGLFSGLKDLQIDLENLDYEVLADSALTEIFHNLIDNSLKYGQNLTQIKISARKAENGYLQVIFEDNGGGIDAKVKPSLFQKGAGKGTGLGLYLIQRICDVYGWKVQEKGEEGRGVLFIFEIPKENTRIAPKA